MSYCCSSGAHTIVSCFAPHMPGIDPHLWLPMTLHFNRYQARMQNEKLEHVWVGAQYSQGDHFLLPFARPTGGGEGGKGPMRASPADKPMKWTGQGFCALLSSFVDNIPSRRHCLPPRGLWGSFPPPCSELDVPSRFGGSGGRLGADITLVAKVISTVVAW